MNEPSQPPGEPSGPPDPDAGHPRLEEAHMWNVVSYLISGPVLFGGIGWALDVWLGTAFLVAVGILAGMAVSLYLVWFRYGTQQ
ncbi:MAG: AtpZ/AtpI family protein [Dermatophilaceae bacterium]